MHELRRNSIDQIEDGEEEKKNGNSKPKDIISTDYLIRIADGYLKRIIVFMRLIMH